MTVLLTGFNAFGGLSDNPSQRLVEKYVNVRYRRPAPLKAEVLPTDFEAGGARMVELIRELRPEAVLCLGVAVGIGAIRLERRAVNVDDSAIVDNAGWRPTHQAISATGPEVYLSSLPLARMREELAGRGLPVEISGFAGTYVCNHVFYVARHEIERLGLRAKCGLVHLPLAADQSEAADSSVASLSMSCLESAVECLLDILQGEMGYCADPR